MKLVAYGFGQALMRHVKHKCQSRKHYLTNLTLVLTRPAILRVVALGESLDKAMPEASPTGDDAHRPTECRDVDWRMWIGYERTDPTQHVYWRCPRLAPVAERCKISYLADRSHAQHLRVKGPVKVLHEVAPLQAWERLDHGP